MIIGQKVGKLRYVFNRDGSRVECLTDAISTGHIISLVGSGGKTSTMYTLGRELALKGEEVILTTSTRILPFENELPNNMKVIGDITVGGKLKGRENTDGLINSCDRLLIEADGSRGLPIKIPASYEPVITDNTDTVIAVLGLSGIGRPIGEVCHRRELVCSFLSKQATETLTVDDAIKIITSDMGLHKNVVARTFILVLNQADSEREIALGLKIATSLPDDVQCILTAYEDIN